MGRVIDITRAGTAAVHVHLKVPRIDWVGRLLGLSREETFLGVDNRWYDSSGNRIMDGTRCSFLQEARTKWDEGRNPPSLWD